MAREIAARLADSRGPVAFLLPVRGFHEWDRAGGPLRDERALSACAAAFRESIRPPTELIEVDAHINDRAFVQRSLKIFDRWVAAGLIRPAAR